MRVKIKPFSNLSRWVLGIESCERWSWEILPSNCQHQFSPRTSETRGLEKWFLSSELCVYTQRSKWKVWFSAVLSNECPLWTSMRPFKGMPQENKLRQLFFTKFVQKLWLLSGTRPLCEAYSLFGLQERYVRRIIKWKLATTFRWRSQTTTHSWQELILKSPLAFLTLGKQVLRYRLASLAYSLLEMRWRRNLSKRSWNAPVSPSSLSETWAQCWKNRDYYVRHKEKRWNDRGLPQTIFHTNIQAIKDKKGVQRTFFFSESTRVLFVRETNIFSTSEECGLTKIIYINLINSFFMSRDFPTSVNKRQICWKQSKHTKISLLVLV